MRKVTLSKTLVKSGAYGLLMGGISLIMSASAFAECGTGCCTQGTTTDCQQCETIFSDAAEKLNKEYEQVLADCCTPTCCETTCNSCADTACGTCGTCGSGCGGHGLFGECCLGDPWALSDQLGDDVPFTIGGWVQFGYSSNNTGLFNQHPHRFNNHQSWLYIEKVADGSCGWDFGYRADLMYGVDAQDTQAFGNNPGNWDYQNGWDHGIYGWAMPQLYAEIANGPLSVKVGHFFTLIGYEVVTAPDNFFFSHAYTMYNSEPFTHTGAIATYTANDTLTLYGGWTLGWDTGFDQFGGGSNFLGGASVGVTDNATFTYMTTFGDFGQRGDGYSHSLVLDVNVTDNINYVIQSDLVSTNQGVNDDQVGINQYLFYTVNDCLAFGTRLEWWRNDGDSQYESTWGLNYKPMANLVVRPEWRYDWNPGTSNEFGTFGVDAILTF